jgi:hypothetical protein
MKCVNLNRVIQEPFTTNLATFLLNIFLSANLITQCVARRALRMEVFRCERETYIWHTHLEFDSGLQIFKIIRIYELRERFVIWLFILICIQYLFKALFVYVFLNKTISYFALQTYFMFFLSFHQLLPYPYWFIWKRLSYSIINFVAMERILWDEII